MSLEVGETSARPSHLMLKIGSDVCVMCKRVQHASSVGVVRSQTRANAATTAFIRSRSLVVRSS